MGSTPQTIDDIHGWFWPEDRVLFSHFLGGDAVLPRGDLVELGTFKGKSAVLIGAYLAEGERFYALDLFKGETDGANAHENRYYPTLSREIFETNYLAFHPRLPEVIEGPSTIIADHVAPRSARFFHIDASHLYEHVAADIRSAQDLVATGAVVVLDDYRAVHTPAVAAAAWEACLTRGFKPFLLTPQKMYGTFDVDTSEHLARVVRLLDHDDRWVHEPEEILGHTVVRAAFAAPEPQVPVAALQGRVATIERQLAVLPAMRRDLRRVRTRQEREKRRAEQRHRRLLETVGEHAGLTSRVLRRLRR